MGGGAVLSPGEYTFSVQSTSLPSTLILRQQSKGETAFMLFARGISQSATSHHSGLNLVLKGDQRTVQSLYLGDLGLVLYYGNPSEQRHRTMARVPPLAEQVPVAASGH